MTTTISDAKTSAASTISAKTLQYSDGKTQFIGKLYWDDAISGKRPAVVVFPEAFGLNEHACERAEMLAQLGYVALAADPHGNAKYFDDFSSVGPAIQALYNDRTEWRGRARAALDALSAQAQVDNNKMAAIGFCFGGTTCLELARTGAPLAAIVTFHAGLIPELPTDAGRIHAKILINHGAEDPIVKAEALAAVTEEFRRDQLDWQIIYFGGALHSFTNKDADARNVPAFAYNARADQRAWTAMRNLFDEVFI